MGERVRESQTERIHPIPPSAPAAGLLLLPAPRLIRSAPPELGAPPRPLLPAESSLELFQGVSVSVDFLLPHDCTVFKGLSGFLASGAFFIVGTAADAAQDFTPLLFLFPVFYSTPVCPSPPSLYISHTFTRPVHTHNPAFHSDQLAAS